MASNYFFSGFASSCFLGLCGRVLPYEPIAILPFAVFLSPFPMIYILI
jgi:hypothetical protein